LKAPLIGVIGGMGTMATAAFYEKLHSLQDVTTEQEFIDVIIYSKPSIPDRTEFILGRNKESPLCALIEAAKILENAGAAILVLPCMTSHFFYDELVKEVRTKLINLPDEVVKAVSANGFKKVGLLATEGAIKGKILQDKFEKSGIETVIPGVKAQEKLTKIIYGIKKGKQPAIGLPADVTAELTGKGAQAIVLGCTELCIGTVEGKNYINTLDILAETTLRESDRQ